MLAGWPIIVVNPLLTTVRGARTKLSVWHIILDLRGNCYIWACMYWVVMASIQMTGPTNVLLWSTSEDFTLILACSFVVQWGDQNPYQFQFQYHAGKTRGVGSTLDFRCKTGGSEGRGRAAVWDHGWGRCISVHSAQMSTFEVKLRLNLRAKSTPLWWIVRVGPSYLWPVGGWY